MKQYETVVGIEVHVELSTLSKVFCSCEASFGNPPNTNTCPVCLGLPGALPVLNKRALEYAIRTALALNCEITYDSKFDRKNYYYPDLVKGYQISQFDLPFGRDGYVDIEVLGETKRIRVKRVHLEEETGKMVHLGDDGSLAKSSIVDYNRSGIGLIEIVTEADISNSEEAKVYLNKLRGILRAIDVSDCKIEQGSMRCEANISIMEAGSSTYGTLCEIKNIASIKAVGKAIEYETKRQIEIVESGNVVEKQTRHWDDGKSATIFMRKKESADDYRYFPEPDLIPYSIPKDWVEEIRLSLPELPEAKIARYQKTYNISKYEATLVVENEGMASFFDECYSMNKDAKTIVNWLLGEVLASLNAQEISISECGITPKHIVELIELIQSGKISGKMAKSVFATMYETKEHPSVIVDKQGLSQISDEGELSLIVASVISKNPEAIEDYRAGKDRALGFLMGQVMKETKGSANPQKVNEMIKTELEKVK